MKSSNKFINYNERILVAGGHGMVGSSIKKALIKAGYGNTKISGQIITPTRKELDFANFIEVENWFKKNKPTVVIIAAAKVGGILANSSKPYDFIIENLKIQTNLIENSLLNNVKRLLFLGSSCIYPKFAKQPIKEEYLLSDELEKTNEFYAIAKISGLKLCQSLRIQHNFDAISLMPTNLYGKGDNYDNQNSHVMASFIKRFYEASKQSLSSVTCWGSGTPLREFMHVDDLGEAVKFVLERWDPPLNKDLSNKKNTNFFLNVGTGKEISIKDLAYKISYYVNYKGEVLWDHSKPDGTPRKQLNINKIKELGWKPKINLDEGIKKTLKSYELDNKKI
jgi:GDP-L-fucose synthase